MSVLIPPTVPAGWAPSWNEQYQTWFYVNTKSKQSQWEVPTSPVVSRPPSPALEGDKLSPLVASATSEADDLTARFESTHIQSSSSRGGHGSDRGNGHGGAEGDGTPPEVPTGWVTRWNDQYQTWFYYNMVTKESTWEKPTGPAESTPASPNASAAPSTATVAAAAAATPVASVAAIATNDREESSGPPSMSMSGQERASEPSSSEPLSREPQSREDVPVVPSGWSTQWNDMYQAWFYVNTATKETTWERPALAVDQPATVSPAPSSIMQRPAPSPSPQQSFTEGTPVREPGSSDVPEVPAGWVARFNEQYQTWFYVNTATGKSSWDRPTSPATEPATAGFARQPQQQRDHHHRQQRQHSSASSSLRNSPRPPVPEGDPELPHPWTKRFNEQYQTWFYVNTQTRQSQWEKPTLPSISVEGAGRMSDEELARRLQAEEDGLAREASPSLPPRPPKTGDTASAGLHRQLSSPGGYAGAGSSHDAPPSYDFAVGSHGRSASYGGPNANPNLQPYHPGHYAHSPSSSSRPASASGSVSSGGFRGSGGGGGGGYFAGPDGSLAPLDTKTGGQKPKKKRSWMLPAGVAAGGVAGLGVLGAGIYALTGSDIGERIIDKVTGDGDEDGDSVVASFIGDVVDAVAGE